VWKDLWVCVLQCVAVCCNGEQRLYFSGGSLMVGQEVRLRFVDRSMSVCVAMRCSVFEQKIFCSTDFANGHTKSLLKVRGLLCVCVCLCKGGGGGVYGCKSFSFCHVDSGVVWVYMRIYVWKQFKKAVDACEQEYGVSTYMYIFHMFARSHVSSNPESMVVSVCSAMICLPESRVWYQHVT